jgi:hypothetical protein
MKILAYATLLTLITSFYFNETRSPTAPCLINLTLGRVQNYPLNFAWHLPTPEPAVTITSDSAASLFWNVSPKSNDIIDYTAEMISNKTAAATMPTLPRICSSLSVIAELPSLPTPSKPCLLIASEPILDFCWNTTPKCSFVTESLDAGATTDIFNTTLTVIQSGTSSFGNGNQSQLLLPVFNSTGESAADLFWNMTPKGILLIDYNDKAIHDKTTVAPLESSSNKSSSLSVIDGQPSRPSPSKPSLLFVSKPILDFYWNKTHNWPVATLTLTHLGTLGIMSTLAQTGYASLPTIPLQLSTSFVSVGQPWLPTTSKSMDMYLSKPLADFFWNATPTDKSGTQQTDDITVTGSHHVALAFISSGISSLNATNHHFSVEWLMHLLLVVLSIYFNSKAKDMASLPSVASTDCAIDFGSIASCEVNNGKSAGIFDDLSSYSFLFGIDDDNNDDDGGGGGGDDGSSLCYSLDSDGIDNGMDSLCYSMGDDVENGDSLSVFSYASSDTSVLPVAECYVPRQRLSARIAAMKHVCYKKFF